MDGDLPNDIRATTRTRSVLRDGREVARGGWVKTTTSGVKA
ncbi:MAG: hypothetical protein U0232_25375 [Thermomicrobiales bacterium]